MSGKIRTYLFSYNYAGKVYGLDVPARSEAEAKGRVLEMSNATYDGVLVAEIELRAPFWKPLFRWLGIIPR